MKILGVDPGLKTTGYGFIESKNKSIKLLEVGTINPKQKDCIQNRLNKVHGLLGELIDKYQPDVLVLEKLYSHSVHPATSIILGHVRGVICLLSAEKKIKFEEHSVKRIRKALLGNGNATKSQIRSIVAHSLNIDESKLTLDASDALALALGYVHINRCKI